MIVHLKNETKLKGFYIESDEGNIIELCDRKDNVIESINIVDVYAISSNDETEFLTISTVNDGFIVIHEFDSYDEDGDFHEMQNSITFPNLDSVVDFTWNELVKPYIGFAWQEHPVM